MKRFLVAALLLGLAASAEARSRRLALYTPWVADVVRAIPPVAGSSGSGSLVAGTTAISGCADTLVLYNDANFVGCDAGLAYNKSANRLTADAFAVRDGFDQSHVMSIIHLANLTADRTLTFNTGDAARTITLGGNLTTVGDNLFNDTAFLIRDPTNTNRQIDFDVNLASDFVATLQFSSDANTLTLSTPDRTRFGFTNTIAGVGSATYFSLNVTGAADAYPAFKFLPDFTPDVPAFITDNVSMSLHVVQRGDEGLDMQNCSAGTSAATNPTLCIHSADGASTTKWIDFKHDQTNGVIDVGTGVLSIPDWAQQSASRVTLAANFTNATTTMSNTALSVTVTSGRKYTFVLRMFLADSVAADGAKLDFEGGTATATNFRAHCTLYDTALLLSTQVAALATDAAVATVTGDAMAECSGSFEPSGNGTFIVRAAKNAHTTGTLTVYRGSYMWVEDTP